MTIEDVKLCKLYIAMVATLGGMRNAAKAMNVNAPYFTEIELVDWVRNQDNYEQIMNQWSELNYSSAYRPKMRIKQLSKNRYKLDNFELSNESLLQEERKKKMLQEREKEFNT